MRLYHYTSAPPKTVKRCSQRKSDGRKPIGFWLSDCDAGDGWKDWCEAEDFNLAHLGMRLIVDVDKSKILHLKSVSALDDFAVEFAKDYSFGSYVNHLVDWPKVADQWSGILISPYQWSRRVDGTASDWYYGWDCASGCVWSPDAVLSMKIDEDWQREAA